MKRILATAKFIDIPAEIADDFLVLTPNSAAAARLGVPRKSLTQVAKEILNKNGFGIASPMRSLTALRSAARKAEPERDFVIEASRLRGILSTTLRTGVDVEAMKRSRSSAARHIGSVADLYRQELAAEKLIDADDALWKAGELIAERKKVIVYGYFRARLSDVQFVDRLAGDGSIFVVPCGDEAIFTSVQRSIAQLQELGWTEQRSPSIDPSARKVASGLLDRTATPDLTAGAFAYEKIEDEVRGALARAKDMIVRGSSPDSIAIVCRKAADYEASLVAVAEEYGLRIAGRPAQSLSETKIGGYVTLLLKAASSGFSYAPTSRLVQHLYGPDLPEAGWNDARKTRYSSCDDWIKAGANLQSLSNVSPRSISEWSQWILDLLPFERVRERAKEEPLELVAYGRFEEALKELETLFGVELIDLETFEQAIGDLFDTASVQDPSKGGIVIHRPDTIIGGSAEHVLVLGLAEGMFPATTSEDTVLDFREQSELEKENIFFDPPIEFPRWERLSFFYTLLAAERSLTLSYPETIGLDEKLPSIFFDDLGITPVASSTPSIASEIEDLKVFLRRQDGGNNETLSEARRRFEVENSRESGSPHDKYDGAIAVAIDAAQRTWSSGQLSRLAQCPFKWFAEKALRLKTFDEGETELRPAAMGNLYHKTLQLAVERAIGAEDIRTAAIENLEEALLEAEKDEEINACMLPNWELRRAEHLNILKKAILSPDFIEDGATVEKVEGEFAGEWRGFKVRGRIDRVDKTDSGYTVVDYKTGAYVTTVRREADGVVGDVQLPIYMEAGLGSDLNGAAVVGKYFSIRQRRLLKSDPIDAEKFELLVRRVLTEGSFAVDPDEGKSTCKYCDFDVVCRYGPRNKRKGK